MRLRRRALRLWIGLFISPLAAAAILYTAFFRSSPAPTGSKETVVRIRENAAPSETEQMVLLRLFYLDADPRRENAALLCEENKSLLLPPLPEARALAALKELSAFSLRGKTAALPSNAVPRHVFFTGRGTAVVNYSRSLGAYRDAGAEAELAAVYAIVHTITANFPEATQVRLLIEGCEQETLAGHVNLSGALLPRPELVQGYMDSSRGIRTEPLPP